MPVSLERAHAPTVRRTAGDGHAPLFRCDQCGKEIKKPAVGQIAWEAGENATHLPVRFLHEGCLEEYRKGIRERLRVDPLENFVESLRRFL
jgi:hypothetical protein